MAAYSGGLKLSPLLRPRSHRFGWRLKDQDDAAVSTPRAHETAFQASEGEVATTCPNQRVNVQLLSVNACARVRAIIDHAPGTAGSYPPTVVKASPSVSTRLKHKENKSQRSR